MTNFVHHNDLSNEAAEKLHLASAIAIDTEAMGLKIVRDRLCVVQLSDGNGDAHLVKFDGSDYSASNLKRLLATESILKIFHYARFDLAIVKHYLGLTLTNIYCTKIASKLVRTYSDAHGLRSLCEELLGVELSKKQQSSDWGSRQLSNDQIKYAAADVLHLHRLRSALDLMLAREGKKELAEVCFSFLNQRVALDLAGFESDIFSHH